MHVHSQRCPNCKDYFIENEIIQNPEFSFIFSTNLDGKIDIIDNIITNINDHRSSVNRERKTFKEKITRYEFRRVTKRARHS